MTKTFEQFHNLRITTRMSAECEPVMTRARFNEVAGERVIARFGTETHIGPHSMDKILDLDIFILTREQFIDLVMLAGFDNIQLTSTHKTVR